MITLLALIAGSAAPALMDELNPLDTVNPLDIAIPGSESTKADLSICPVSKPSSWFTGPAVTDNSAPVNGRELTEFHIKLADENTIINRISAPRIDATEHTPGIDTTGIADNLATRDAPVTGSDHGLPPVSHDPQTTARLTPTTDPWPKSLLHRDNSITYGDFKDWLKDINRIYDEEPIFRSALQFSPPSDRSQLFPEHISRQPTYGWMLDNCLTDWINNRVMRVITPDSAEPIAAGEVTGLNNSEQESAKTLDQIYLPLIEKLEFQDAEQNRAFFQKLYELLAPLRGLLVIAITGINQSQGNRINKGHKLSGLLQRSGFHADNIRVVSSQGQSFLLARKGQVEIA